MLDLIFVKVQSSMQLLSEIHGYLSQDVKENVHGTEQPKCLCWDLYGSWAYGRQRPVTFLPVLTFWADIIIRVKQTHTRTHIHSLTCAHTRTRTRSHCDSLFLSLWMMYGTCSSGAVSTLCFVWKFSCITFHSLIHAYMHINNACNLISVYQ